MLKDASGPLGHVYYVLDPSDSLDPSDIDIELDDLQDRRENGSVGHDRGVVNHIHDQELGASSKTHQQLISKAGEPTSRLNTNVDSTG